MSYVSVWKPVRDQVVQASHNARNEIIGLLLGRLDDDTIVIDDSVTGEFKTREHGATLPTETLARIADDIVSGRIKGSIVGWYHSHTEGGLFLSDTDIETQKNLQQFSTLVTAMVVDASSGEVGYFRVDPQTGRQTRIAEENITVFEDRGNAIPVERRGKTAVRATPTVEVHTQPPQPQEPTRRLILAILLIVLVASIALLGFIFTRPSTPVAFAIIHTPIHTATVGTPIEITANVTGNIRTVTLSYSRAGLNAFTEAEMKPVAPSQYIYEIAPENVTGNIEYYIEAVDALGNREQTGVYAVPVADFSLSTTTQSVTVYRNGSTSTPIDLGYVNGFAEPLTFSASGAPEGVTVAFSPTSVSAGATRLTMTIKADAQPPTGSFSMQIAATYEPFEGTRVIRETGISVLVTDFDLKVSPLSKIIPKSTTATYTVTITVAPGFVDPIQVSVQGLPQGASYELIATGTSVTLGGSGTTTLTLRVVTTSSLKLGTYALTVIAVGGGLTRHVTIELIVR